MHKPTRPTTHPLVMLMGGQIITALAGLGYGKLTSVYIAPAVWGNYSLIVMAMTLLHSLFVTPTLQSFKVALTRFPRCQVVTFYGLALFLLYGIIVLVLVLWAGQYEHNGIGVLTGIAAVGQGIYQFGSNYVNALGQHRRYTLLQTGHAIGTLLAFICIVIGFNEPTVTGLWQVTAFLNTLTAVAAGWWLLRRDGPTFGSVTVDQATELIRSYGQYVRPLLSLACWGWLINYADRYLIRLYLTDTDVGQYSMGYSLGSKLGVLVAPLLAFLSPQLLQLRATGQAPGAANGLIQRYLMRYILLAGAGCVLFYLNRDWLGGLLLSARYAPAFDIGPIVAVGYLFLTSIYLLELKWYTFGQTKLVLWHNVAGAVANVGLNFLLIPRMGIRGAALATLLGFASQFLLAIGLFLSTRLDNR